MRKLIGTTLVLLLSSIAVMAQDTEGGYYSGYIVRTEGDTLRGKILKDNNYLNPKSVTFNANGTDQEYTYNNILSFYINELDLLFESYMVTKNMDNNTLSVINGDLTNKVETGRHFLLTLAKSSEYGVYSYTEENGVERLYYRNGPNMDELIFTRRYVYSNGVPRLQEKTRYRIQLLGFFIDCDDVDNKINSSNYSRGAIRKLFLAYANCQGINLAYEPRKESSDIRLGVIVGFGRVMSSQASVTLRTLPSQARRGLAEHQGGNWFELGLTAVFESKQDSRFAFKTELKVRSQTIENEWNSPAPVNGFVSRIVYTYNNTYAALNLLGNWNLKQWDTGVLFLEGGLYFAASLSGDFDTSSGVFQTSGDYVFTTETTDIAARTSDIGLSIGVGAELNSFGASLRLNSSISDGEEPTTTISISATVLSLNFFYLF